MGLPDHLTCLLRHMYAGQEATVRTGHRTTDWFQIEKGVRQGCILSPCSFNLCAEFSSVQSLSRVGLIVTPWTTAHQASLSITNSQSLPNSCPLSWWCHPNISSSVVPFSSCPQSLPASGSFKMTQLFASGGQNIGVSVSASVLPMNTQDWSPLGWTGWIFLQSKGLSRVLLQHHSSKASILQCSAFFIVQLSHLYMTTGKTIALTRQTFVDKVMSLLLNMLSRFIIAFLPRSKCLLISWLQSPSAVILEPPKTKSATVSTVSPSICHEVLGLDANQCFC